MGALRTSGMAKQALAIPLRRIARGSLHSWELYLLFTGTHLPFPEYLSVRFREIQW